MLQKYFLKYIELYLTPKKFQISQFWSGGEPSEIYISLSFLYKCETFRGLYLS